MAPTVVFRDRERESDRLGEFERDGDVVKRVGLENASGAD